MKTTARKTPEENIVLIKEYQNEGKTVDEIASIFEEYIESFKIPVIYLTGTVQERVDQFHEAIKQFKEYKEKQNA